MLLEQWASFVVAHLGGLPPRVLPRTGTKLLHQSRLTGWAAWKILEIVYGQGGPALVRKRQKALEILASEPPARGAAPISRKVVRQSLKALAGRPLREVPQNYVCPCTKLRLGKLLERARHGLRRDLHDLFDQYDADWRTTRLRWNSTSLEIVQQALETLAGRPLREVSRSYVCPRTELSLGTLLERARRRGLRPDLNDVFDQYDPLWRMGRSRNCVPIDLVERALVALDDRRLGEIPQGYVCRHTGVRLGGLLARARRGGRPDLNALFAHYDRRWEVPARRPGQRIASAPRELLTGGADTDAPE